jgi:hypothetical protein
MPKATCTCTAATTTAMQCRPSQPSCPQVNMDVEARFAQDMLKGDECYEIRLKLLEHKDERFPFKDDD